MGKPHHRPGADAPPQPEHRRRYRRSARQYRQLPDEPPDHALQRAEGAPGGARRTQPGRLHARPGGGRQQPLEAAARVLHPRHAGLFRGGRGDPEGPAQHGSGEAPAGRERLRRHAGHLHRRAGPRHHQDHGRCHGGSAEADRLQCGFRRHRLGHHRPAPRHEEPGRPGRLVHVPHLARRGGLREPGQLQRDPRQWRQRLVWLAGGAGGRDAGRRMV